VTTAYPLAWPQGFTRNKTTTNAKTRTSVAGAVANVMAELRRFGNDTSKAVTEIVISSNVTLTDGRPRDPGVACYFMWDGIQACIAVDRYNKPEENLQAIALIIDAERTKLRHGGLNIVRASFRGYASLPPPIDSKGQLPKPWWDVLGVKERATLAEARVAYLRLVKEHHPDTGGGDPARFNLVVNAWTAAQEALKT
jgi:hypothetical protein